MLAIELDMQMSAGGMHPPPPSNYDQIIGYYSLYLPLPSLCYLYVIVAKVCSKSPSMIADWFVMLFIVMLQFGIPTVLAVWHKNILAGYNDQVALK